MPYNIFNMQYLGWLDFFGLIYSNIIFILNALCLQYIYFVYTCMKILSTTYYTT